MDNPKKFPSDPQRYTPVRSETGTQTIDLNGLGLPEFTDSGSFDLRALRGKTLGKILEAIPIPTFIITGDFTIAFANRACFKTAGADADLLNESFLSLFPHPTAKKQVQDALREILTKKRVKPFQALAHINKHNSWQRLNFRPIRLGPTRSILLMMEDLTAAKKQIALSKKYVQLVEVFPIGIGEFVLSKPVPLSAKPQTIVNTMYAATLVGGNQEFLKLLGHDSPGKMLEKQLKELIVCHGEHSEKCLDWIRQGLPIRSFQRKHIVGDETLYFELTLVANIKRQRLKSFWLMCHDITNQKLIQEDLRAAKERLEEKVAERTAELTAMNEKLRLEIAERRLAEEKLADNVKELQEAIKQVRTLSGLLPICASCKKIRDDQGYWTQVEVYVSRHTDADFTHSICPDCVKKLYPEYYDNNSSK